MGRELRFSHDDALRFAAWSGDRNPLHVDPDAAHRSVFGQPVIHGVLTTIRALCSGLVDASDSLDRLEVEFRGAVHPDQTYNIDAAAAGTTLSVRKGQAGAVTVRVNGQAAPIPSPELSWVDRARASAAVSPSAEVQPADLDAPALHAHREVAGWYRTGAVPPEYLEGSVLRPVQARVLALCSYVIGMELPGLRSLFTRLDLGFAATLPDTGELLYRARVGRFDPQFRLLDVHLDVATAAGELVAVADLRAYVRFAPAGVDPAATTALLASDPSRLRGRVVLVTGGTRGLGAEITTAFAMAGCQVYASYHRSRAAAEDLSRSLRAAGAQVDLIEGDAASKDWCESAVAAILGRHGRLDLLVLNACAPPDALAFGPDSSEAYNAYVAANLPLAQVPLATCLSAIGAAGGTIVGISSSFVSDPPAGFGHYVALKEAVEATIRAAVREMPGVRAVLARPPRLRTAWNDTPTGVLGTIGPRDAAVHLVTRLAQLPKPPTPPADEPSPQERVELLSEFPAFAPVIDARPGPDTPDDAMPEFALSIAASFTAEPLVDGLRFWFRELGVRARVELAPYGQILQTLLSPGSDLSGGREMHVVMLRLRDWLRELRNDDVASVEFVRGYLQTTSLDLERAMRAHRARAGAETLVVFCPSAPASADAAEALLEEAEADLLTRLAGLPGLTAIRARDFHGVYSVHEAGVADHVRDHVAHIPYQTAYLHTLATLVVRHVHRKLAQARKVVVVDCDNTLWAGVVGEVGVEGLTFDDGHTALHAALARLSDSGVLIALCSKNEESDVWRVFEARTDFGLRRDCIVTAAINWRPKSANLRAMAERLNLGLDSFVFIDDSPVECAEVRAACPQVLTLEWPQDPARAKRLLQHVWELDPRLTTTEDRRRTELYKEEFRRQELQSATLTFRDFIASLDLAIDVSPLAPADLARASQLTLRTNQLNFTTRRRDEAELQALVSAGTHEIRTVRVRDRFGDYGLVGLLIAEARGTELVADTFLLSCRVLGRGVEHRMVAEVGRIAAERHAATVRLRVEPTPRNTPARHFLHTVTPAAFRRDDGTVLEAVLPADFARAMQFVPPEEAAVPVVEDPQNVSTPAQADPSMVRIREAQIARTAFDLSTPAALLDAIDGSQSPASSAAMPVDAAFVFETFARALGVSTEYVKEVDSLERLGCDSFKIVEITVRLLERLPSLPGTLLFEHKSVSAIATRIGAVMDGERSPDADTAPVPRPAADGGHAGDIAVVGLHLRCAGARSPAELWDLLGGGTVAVRPVPEERSYFLGRLQDERPHFAGLLDDLDRFDPELFGITPREAELMDPQLRLFLEVAWSALEDAGCLGKLDPDTGVFAGVMYGDYGYRANVIAREAGNPFKCWEGFSLANRLSQVFGFRGPSLAVDTACSSSATAIHLACRALHAGDCGVAIAGGVNLILDPDRFVQLGRLGILSTSGRCLPFGADADGTVLGEGAGVVVLRPLADALRRGDRIYGVIKATGVSTGSGTVGFTAPNPQAQAAAIRRAVAAARVDPRTITYVETHGTGTALGDPIEVRGLMLAYSSPELLDPDVRATHVCSIGSIKPNIGHLEAGAGVLGLIKVLLQLRHGMLLPSVTSQAPNPQIPFAQSPFSVQRDLARWDRPIVERAGDRLEVPRRAALNSFGVGGANVHVILEEAPAPRQVTDDADRSLHILALTARTDDGLRQRAADFAGLLSEDAPLSEADFCFSANTAQRPLAHRAAVIGRDRAELRSALTALASGGEPAAGAVGRIRQPGERPKVAFLFTGQGSQYPGMGRELYESHRVFRAALDRCFALFGPLVEPDLKTCLFAPHGSPEAEILNQTGHTQPALFSLGYALSELWQSWGISPDVVLGHSIGELTAMCVAGGLSLKDAVKVVAARGRLMQALPSGGAMTSIMTTETRVAEAIAGSTDLVAIAAINGPSQVVISGDAAAVTMIAERFAAEGVRIKPLVVSHAFHSPLMKPMLAEYAAVLQRARFSRPAVTFVSAVEGRIADAGVVSHEYWLRNVIDPVRFTDAIRAADDCGTGAYLEMGPQPVLISLAQQSLHESEDRLTLPSLRRDGGAWPVLMRSLARLYTAGSEIDWERFDGPYRRTRVSLPHYPFGGRRYWIGPCSAPSPVARDMPAEAGEHPEACTYEVVWREQPLGLTDSHVSGVWAVFGASGGIGTAIARILEARGARCILAPGADAADPSGIVDRVPAADLRGIVLVSGTDEADGGDRARAAARRVEAAVRVMQAAAGGHGTARLWIVTAGAVPVALGPRVEIDPGDASLWGAGRTLALEHAERWGGLIDVDPSMSPARAAESVTNELLNPGQEDQVALRERGRFVPRLTRLDAQARSAPTVSPAGTYLVTGGLGALGLQIARWLVSRGARHLVLTGRRGAGTPGADDALQALRARGATVTVVAADISRADGVAAALDAVSPSAPLTGIFHAAGIDSVTPIEELAPDELRRVMDPKAGGAWLLHEATKNGALDLFVGFSSIASVLGSPGRTAYAAANAFVDALAHERRRVGLHALSVNWGPWAGGGMASRPALEQYERAGNRGLSPANAISAMESLLAAGATQATVADIDWAVFKPTYEMRRRHPILSALDAGARESGQEVPAGRPVWIEQLSALPVDRREDHLEMLLRGEIAQTLGFEIADVAADRRFRDLGMDSLMAAEFAQRLQKCVGIRSTALVFEHPTAKQLARHLLERLAMPAEEALEAGELAVAGAAVAAGVGMLDFAAGWRRTSNGDRNVLTELSSSEGSVGSVDDTGRTERYRPALEPDVLAFSRMAWPGRSAGLIAPRWRWMFVDSARRVGVEPMVWMHRQGGRIVGHNGAIPVRLAVGEVEHVTAWLVDTMVLEEYRSEAVGARLMVEAHEDLPFALSLGQTEQMRAIQLRLGWRQVAPLETAQLLIRPERVLKGKVPSPAALAAGLALRAGGALRDAMKPRTNVVVTEVPRFDESHDRLWQTCSSGITCVVRRDASYLNWKYVDQPGQNFLRLEIVSPAGVRGIVVLMFREPDDAYLYRRAFLVDVVAPLADGPFMSELMTATIAAATERDADALVCLHIGARLSAALAGAGFRTREPSRYLLVRPGPIDGPERERLLDAANWFVTHGDSDIDRPW